MKSCYKSSLGLALENKCASIAFPLISSGIFGYPKDKALQVAVSAISEFLLSYDMMVYLVVFDKAAFQLGNKLFASIKAFIDDHYVDDHVKEYFNRRREVDEQINLMEQNSKRNIMQLLAAPFAQSDTLIDFIKRAEETFSERLLRLIDKSGKTDVEVYKRANVDRKLFSKIRNDPNYKPSKITAIAFAVALELNLTTL